MNRYTWFFAIAIAVYVLVCLLVYYFQELLFFHPRKLAKDHVFDFKTPFTEFYLPTPDGEKLHGLYFNVPNARGLVLYFHGNADNLVRWGQVAQDFTRHGYEVCMIDYRGFGKSTGRITEETMFYQDARLVYDHVKNRYPAGSLIIYGRSLGSGIATRLALETGARALVLETPYHSLAGLGEYYMPLLPHTWLIRYTVPTYQWIVQVKCPVYIFHGTKDGVIPYKYGKRLAGELGGKATLVTLPGGRHKNLNTFSAYHAGLKAILNP